MQPLGRKSVQMPNAKNHPKEKGKNIAAWWEGFEWGNKNAEKEKAKKEIKKEIDAL